MRFCEELKTTTKAKDVFQFVKGFFSKHEWDIQSTGSVCAEGASAILGNKYGFSAVMKQKIPHVQSTHCFLHRYAFASKALPTKLKELLDVSAKTIKWIRGRVLTHRFFKSLCEDLGSKRTVSLFQIEVRWLSRWRVLTRFFELRKEPVFPEKRHYDLLCRVTIANLS